MRCKISIMSIEDKTFFQNGDRRKIVLISENEKVERHWAKPEIRRGVSRRCLTEYQFVEAAGPQNKVEREGEK